MSTSCHALKAVPGQTMSFLELSCNFRFEIFRFPSQLDLRCGWVMNVILLRIASVLSTATVTNKTLQDLFRLNSIKNNKPPLQRGKLYDTAVLEFHD